MPRRACGDGGVREELVAGTAAGRQKIL